MERFVHVKGATIKHCFRSCLISC